MSGHSISATVLCRACDAEISVLSEICPKCGVRQYDSKSTALAVPSEKLALPAVILAFFFGVFGAHRFYVGRIPTALLQLFTLGGLGIWAMIDVILILFGEFRDREGHKLTRWV
jgi:TM2 domain-containing membrane protein YozV